MGEVVAFRMREKTSRHQSEPPTGGAQILFFLGVRYLRAGEQPDAQESYSPDQGRGPQGGKKRKSRFRA